MTLPHAQATAPATIHAQVLQPASPYYRKSIKGGSRRLDLRETLTGSSSRIFAAMAVH